MTENQFIKKVKSMNKEIKSDIEKECKRLFNCGGIDSTSYENNCLLPKIILSVALKNMALQYTPLSEYKAEADNLKHF